MKNQFHRIYILGLVLLSLSCSSEEEPVIIDDPSTKNTKPVILNQQFDVPESLGGFQSIGKLEASDADNDNLTFRLESDIELSVNPVTGIISLKSKSILDYETAETISFVASVTDTKNEKTEATITINVLDVEDGPLTNFQKDFINEYIYLTYKLEPTVSGGNLSEKWKGEIRLFMEGDLPNDYQQTVQGFLNEFNALFTDGTNLELVSTREESNVHLIMGPTSSVQQQWPDMFNLISGNGFGGYALYNTNADFNINKGRIWMGNDDEGLFKHELGHIIGLGHTSTEYCEGDSNSVMCPGTAKVFNFFDREIIKTLYRPDTDVGLNQQETRAMITEYILEGSISL